MSSALLFEQIDQWIEDNNEGQRGHLGMSQIGDEDERKLWLQYHWCLPSDFKGRMLRLFDLGNRIEDQLVHFVKESEVFDLSAVDAEGNQYRASFLGGHFGGSCDGFAKRVVPEDPEQILVFESKSANDKRWKELNKSGDYQGWSRSYKWQLHCYMGCFGLTKSMAVVVNKNDSSIYSEIVDFEPSIWEQAQEKAQRIITSDAPPPGKSENDWELKQWNTSRYREIYLGKRLPGSVNCRNCHSSSPVMDGTNAAWRCARFNKELTIEEQRAGCRDHRWMPSLVKADFVPEESNDDVMTYRVGIFTFHNVTADKLGDKHFSSPEMRELSKIEYRFGDTADLEKLRNFFDGTLEDFKKIQVMDEDRTPF